MRGLRASARKVELAREKFGNKPTEFVACLPFMLGLDMFERFMGPCLLSGWEATALVLDTKHVNRFNLHRK